jgi:glycosyltransferase involved in cell wall biosynthesis
MRVGLVNGGFALDKVGGSELQTMLLGRELSAVGDEVHYIAVSSSAPDLGVSREEGMLVHRLDKARTRRSRRAALHGLVQDLSLDILYVRIIGWIPDVLAIGRASGVGVVAQVASDLDLVPARGTRALLGLRVREFQRITEHNAGMRAFGAVDHVIVQTESQLQSLRRVSHVPATVIKNMFSEVAPRAALGPRDTVVWVGSLKQVKRPEAFVRLAQELADAPARFVMAGEAQDHALGELVRAAASRLPNLSYLGPLSVEEASCLIADSLMLVNTSSAEGFPNTFIQAWSAGVPVATLGVDPDRVISRLGLGGVAAAERGLHELVRDLIDDTARRALIGARAAAYAAREHSVSRNAPAFRSVLASVAARSR